MVFSSLPPYLDPSNWHQQQNHHIINGSSGANHLLPPTPPPAAVAAAASPPPPGSVRPGSMSERARVANIPMPDSSLKCPRCESTNTKFCYFNNYSLSQPRHFCKTCRRYWTRGGALRNVPVGGGCRRNKRTSKSAASKSSPASGDRQTTSTSTSTISTGAASAASLLGLSPQFPPLRFMSPLSQLTDNFTGDVGLNFSGMSAPLAEMGFHGSGIEPAWRLQQFPFLEAASSGLYQFHSGEPAPKLSSSLLTQLASVKMDENADILNPSKPLMAANGQWNSSTNWTELSNFTSSSTRTPL